MSQFFASGGQSIGASALASVLPVNIQDLFPLGLTGWVSLQSKGLSRVFSKATVQKHQFFSTQQWHPTPVLLPGKSHGQRSLVGCSPLPRFSSPQSQPGCHENTSLKGGKVLGNKYPDLLVTCLKNPSLLHRDKSYKAGIVKQ